ncbi:MAG: NADH-quinone oxidoreductase subunit C [Ktedonobacterales bacterium]
MADGQATQNTQVTDPEQPAPFIPADPLAAATVTLLRERFPDDVLDVSEHRGETTVVLRAECIEQACLALRDAPGLRYNFMADLTAVDWPEREPRYDIVYHLLSLETRAVVRLKVRVGDDDTPSPEVPTVTTVWPAANFYEREVFDLFGVRFAGHPNLTRIMMPSDWVGHPLRKDYPLTGIHLPSPHWGGQIPLEQPLPAGTGQQTLRTPDGAEEPPAIGLQDD